MLEILTLLHGLLMGPMVVDIRVPSETARVEVRLDGRLVGLHEEPPWQVQIPFPEEPKPAWLEVAAVDGGGRVLARIEKRVNLSFQHCSPPSEVAVEATPFFIDIPAGTAEPTPAELADVFRVKGEPVEVLALESGPSEVMLVMDPSMQETLDKMTLGFLKAKAVLPGISRIVLKNDEDLLRAAVDSLSAPKRTTISPPETAPQANGASSSNETDEIRSSAAQGGLSGLSFWRSLGQFEIEGRLRFVWPSGPPIAALESEAAVFPLIGPFNAEESGPLWHIHDAAQVERQKRIADAVAVSGWQAASLCRRRAVMLFLSVLSARSDASVLSIPAVQSYMQSVQVPLLVLRDDEWTQKNSSLGDVRDGPDPWGATAWLLPQNGNPNGDFTRDFVLFQRQVQQVLERQRIVWLAGHHLPHEIEIPEGAGPVTASGGQIAPGDHLWPLDPEESSDALEVRQ